MRELTQPWKLCRSFGGQPVGSFADPRWPKAAIATLIISGQASYLAFHWQGDICFRLANLSKSVATDHRDAGLLELLWPLLNCSPNLQTRGLGLRYMPCLQSTISLSLLQLLLPRVSSDVVARYHHFLVALFLSMEVASIT
jgi:hypothetical protein